MRIAVHVAVLAAAILMCGVAVAAPAAPLDSHQTALLDKYLAGTPDPADLGNGGGITAQTLAWLGREDLVMRPPFSHRRPGCAPLLENGAPVDPAGYVARLASGYRVTMVNEAHDMPQGRAFNLAVAQALRPLGYDLYAAETFADRIGATRPAWPLLADGDYAGEPIYGRLIRGLRLLGYRLLAYEYRPAAQDGSAAPPELMAARETAQAANLAARLAQARPTDKMLVHVGYGHLMKTAPPDAPTQMMAQRFKAQTGIDPLTVDQTSFWSRDGNYQLCNPATFRPADPGTVYIAAPRPSFTRGRPDWRLAAGDRFAPIPPALRRPGEAAIYEAHADAEPSAAVPLDRLLVRPGEDIPLLLPPGRYRVAVWTVKGGWSAAIPLTVAAGS